MHEVLLFYQFLRFVNFVLLYFFVCCDVNAILSLEYVYDEKCLTLMRTVTRELRYEEPSLGLSNLYLCLVQLNMTPVWYL